MKNQPVMKKIIYLILAGAVICGCSPKVASKISSSYQPLGQNEEVAVIDVDQPQPENAVVLGSIRIGDSGFTTKNGTYEAVLNIAKQQARQAGGNVVKLTEHKSPDAFSTIHRIKADVLRVDNITDILAAEQENENLVYSHPDYAVIYFYREPGSAPLVVYDVHIGDVKVFESRSKNYAEVKVYDEGEISIWAKTESKDELPLTVKNGCEYYVRCGTTIGVFIGRPKLEKISNMSGRKEYESLKEK